MHLLRLPLHVGTAISSAAAKRACEGAIAMPGSTHEKRLLLFGASRGLGLAIAQEYLKRGWNVVATARKRSRTMLHELVGQADGRLAVEIVDIADSAEVAALRRRLASDRFDLLFVNAGVTNDDRETIADVSTEEFVRVMVTNALSPMRVVETFQDAVPPTGAIAIMSSGQGSVGNNENGGHEVYRASKAALNMLMRSFAARHRGDPRTLLLLAPGWVRTDMSGPAARLSIEESIPNLVKVIAAQAAKGGLHYLDYLGRTVPW
jgi:NAD(P)-dependent dehydrogenase (short-subunit alcohol dehydrogenase family)